MYYHDFLLSSDCPSWVLATKLRLLLLHNQWHGNAVKLVNRNGSETADKGDGFDLPDEKAGAVLEAKADVAEILIAPSLFEDGAPFHQPVGNQVIGMNAGVPVLEADLLHVKPFPVPTDNLASQEFAFPHDSFRFPLDNDGDNDEDSQKQQYEKDYAHDCQFVLVHVILM